MSVSRVTARSGMDSKVGLETGNFFSGNRPVLIGHRGAAGLVDENTLESVQHSVELGVPAVEIDIQVTRDGHAVLLHDETFDRTTNGSGRADAMDLDAVRRLRTSSGFAVPTLGEAFQTFQKKDLRFFVDMKRVEGFEEGILQMVHQYDLIERTLFDTELFGVAARLREVDSKAFVAVSPLNVLKRGSWIQTALDVGANHIDAFHHFLTRGFVERSHEAGLTVSAWIVNRRSTVESLMARGVDGIMGDYPDIFVDPGAKDHANFPF